MKIIFNRSTVSAAVAPLMYTASGKSTLNAPDGILIDAKFPDECILTTFDNDKGLRIKIEAKVLEEGAYIYCRKSTYTVSSQKPLCLRPRSLGSLR